VMRTRYLLHGNLIPLRGEQSVSAACSTLPEDGPGNLWQVKQNHQNQRVPVVLSDVLVSDE